MRIQNKHMAGQTLACRYTRDEDGVPKAVMGDAMGIFDMPEKDAKMLLETPGWLEVVAKAEAPKAVAKPATIAPPPSPSMGEEATQPESEASSEDSSEEDKAEETPVRRRRRH